MGKLTRILAGFLVGACVVGGFATDAFAKLPKDMAEFQTRYNEEGKTPEGAAKLWMEAVFLYQQGDTKPLGRKMLLELTKNLPKDFDLRNPAYAKMMERINGNPEIFRSFCAGSSPENNYKADPNNCEFTITNTREETSDSVAVFLQSSGADAPRPIKMTKVDGLWKAYSYSSMYLQIQPAKK